MHDPKDTLTGTAREAWSDYVRYHRERAHSVNTVTNIGGALLQLQPSSALTTAAPTS